MLSVTEEMITSGGFTESCLKSSLRKFSGVKQGL